MISAPAGLVITDGTFNQTIMHSAGGYPRGPYSNIVFLVLAEANLKEFHQ